MCVITYLCFGWCKKERERTNHDSLLINFNSQLISFLSDFGLSRPWVAWCLSHCLTLHQSCRISEALLRLRSRRCGWGGGSDSTSHRRSEMWNTKLHLSPPLTGPLLWSTGMMTLWHHSEGVCPPLLCDSLPLTWLTHCEIWGKTV